MDLVSALGVVAATSQFVEQTLMVSDALCRYCRTVKEAPKQSRELRLEMLQLSDILEDLHSAIPRGEQMNLLPKTNNLTNTIKDFEETIKEMAQRVEIKEKELSWKRLQWPFDQKENQKYLQKLERFKGTFLLAFQTIQACESAQLPS